MTERIKTILCTFDPASPRITAFEIHEWNHSTLRIPDQTVTMIQFNGSKGQVFIKLVNNDCVQSLLKDTTGEAKYKHNNGELSTVGIAVAGLGTKRARIANLPPEVLTASLTTSLAPYGRVLPIQEEMWAKTYTYAVASGIRQATIMLTKHIPPHLTVARTRVVLSFDSQPASRLLCLW
jgi:hypothetical protein